MYYLLLAIAIFVAVGTVFVQFLMMLFRAIARQSVTSFNEIAKKSSKVPQSQITAQLQQVASNSPFAVSQQGNIITVSWKLADASWFEFFKKADFKSEYELQIMLVDPYTVRVIEVRKELSKKYGLGSTTSVDYFRGWQPFTKTYSTVYAVTDIFPPKVGQAYEITYDARSFREPVLKLLAESGWTIQPCFASLKYGI